MNIIAYIAWLFSAVACLSGLIGAIDHYRLARKFAPNQRVTKQLLKDCIHHGICVAITVALTSIALALASIPILARVPAYY